MEGKTSHNVETGRARAHVHKSMSQNVAFRPALLSGCSRSSAYLHKKFNFGLICVAHLHLLLSGPFFITWERRQNIYTYIISEEMKRLGFWSVRIVTGAAEATSRDNRERTRELNLRTDTPQKYWFILFSLWFTDLKVFKVDRGACFCMLVVIPSQLWCPSDGGSYTHRSFSISCCCTTAKKAERERRQTVWQRARAAWRKCFDPPPLSYLHHNTDNC